ncbi:hypothetical protein LK994_03230 [Ferruginibacter lapsinanis]|uniref:hypothetical protein n=1 Tax=Ferruginibacter lapsinanis TaxID=563172 RepID=UPI001E4B2113|nr:hypothetical protein [Ferruginibacter lapsinanis]UEG50488.1 hypothetical protein LK994_03230 [Ferruginibacter lapsinanis]
MKKVFVLSILAFTIFSCAKKVTPATAAEKKPTEEQTVVVAPEAMATNVASGKVTYEAKCGRCHGLKEPGEFTAERWVGLVNWMAPKAHLSDTEKADVLAYVQAGAKKG